MERFKGILICTTNKLNDIDHASIRRFQHKLGFEYLGSEGNVIFYQKFLRDLIGTSLKPEDQTRLRAISNLAPGDFKTVRERFSFTLNDSLSHQTLVVTLKNETEIKKIFLKTRSIGF